MACKQLPALKRARAGSVRGREACAGGKRARAGSVRGREACSGGKRARAGSVRGREACIDWRVQCRYLDEMHSSMMHAWSSILVSLGFFVVFSPMHQVQATCNTCPYGYSCEANAFFDNDPFYSNCKICPVGTFANTINPPSCTLCPTATQKGSTVCTSSTPSSSTPSSNTPSSNSPSPVTPSANNPSPVTPSANTPSSNTESSSTSASFGTKEIIGTVVGCVVAVLGGGAAAYHFQLCTTCNGCCIVGGTINNFHGTENENETKGDKVEPANNHSV